MSTPEATPGLDLERLGAWLAEHVPGAKPAITATMIAGGRSNLTYVVSDGTQEWIVRRPPLGHVLATAHDMGREHRVMAALADTAVPVPRTFGFCDDTEVLGAPFYVMERVHGTPYRSAAKLEPLGPEFARDVSTRLVDTMAELHRVEPDSVGLGDFGRPEGYLARQVERWRRQLESSYNRDLPAAEELHRLLAAATPAESGASIVHGDFRLDNVLVDEAGRPTAVLDWEMATLGDPLADLALMLVYHRLAQVLSGNAVADASNAPGFLAEDEIIGRYAEVSGRDLAHFGFYLGLGAYKLAAILEGIHFRYLQGQTVGEGFDRIGDAIHPLLETGLAAIKEN